ncbi:isochorismatase family protein [Streptomyces gobiensis]|uniref:isochorismatase family protein n=1 Tax=Streptomyces gobiensis TaxID=2875706 RepID=UPI001E56EF45|nr:isochorismatase family protein [Streptomyces gobiensis]UGY91927.1 isochorismatase family protein [Streptomyces gobiensis]
MNAASGGPSGGLDEDYRAAGFGRRIGWGERPAVLLVDPVRAYADPDSALFLRTAADALAAMERLARTARQTGLPVVFTAVRYTREPASHVPHFHRKVPGLDAFREDSPHARFTAACPPLPGDDTVYKHYPSAFFGTGLHERLTSYGVDTLVIGGFSTSGCVRASALDALQYGFQPLVVREAVADRDPAPHEANLFDLDSKYADAVGLDEACAALGGLLGGRPPRSPR